MNTIIIDLETIKATKPVDTDYLITHIKHAAFKSDEAKAKSIEKQKSEVVERSVFDGAFGEIVTIGFAIDDNPVSSLQRTGKVSEKEVIQSFFDALSDLAGLDHKAPHHMDLLWVAHNKSFDFKFLFKRCVINNINTHGIKVPHNDRHGTRHAFCTMEEWNGFGSKAGGSLDSIAHVLGLSGKDGVDGSKVWGMWEDGQYQAIAKYCENDVELTREIYKRMTFKDHLGTKLKQAA